MRVARDQRMGAGASGASGSRGKMGRSGVGVSSGVDSDTWAAFRAAEMGVRRLFRWTAVESMGLARVGGFYGCSAAAVPVSGCFFGRPSIHARAAASYLRIL